ncbi:putative PI3 PI4-kinase family protein [Lyophyllum shimeji]|uniref:PI3 PI4-kinase family protein n=1 Tax=Lyophyllum shimeji TaxID=47721 RepID=A0A9P3UHE9_LYOSH|nr:putative PI3 PI4-kinase family protein [Lyophyllum shimeji]
MAAVPSMEPSPHLATTSDLEIRAGRLADPNIDLKTKHAVAAEIREMMDTVRDTESIRAIPVLIPALLDLLRNSEVALHKDTMEYSFRRMLLEIINRLPVNEAVRPFVTPIFNCMLHVLRTDNEENGSVACKTLLDLIRGYRTLTEECLSEFVTIFLESFRNMKDLVVKALSEDSSPLDPNIVPLSLRSFKVVGEMGMVVVIISQIHRAMVAGPIQTTIAPAFEVLALESPAQKKAREDYEAMGNIWSGMAPTIKNTAAYTDFVHCQIKVLSYLAYVMRFSGEADEKYGETLILTALRMLQDCPANGIALRKELMVVFRHLMGLPVRKALFPHLDKLLDEDVLLGKGVSSKEMLRAAVYSAVADLVHHIRNDLNANQLARIVHVYSRLIHNPALGNNLHTMSAKMMFGLTEPILAKETPKEAARLLGAMFETCLERLEALALVHDEVMASTSQQKEKGDGVVLDAAFIEKARPIGGAVYANERPEELVHESRLMFRTLLHGFRVCLAALKKCDAPTPDGELFFRLFEGCIRCMSVFDPDPRINEQNDAIDWFGHALLEINLHVFQEVWTHKMEFFFQCASKRMILLNICQFLFTREPTSPTLLAIVLSYLVDRLPLLGEYDDMTAAATIRLFKMAFGAVALYPSLNEPILKAHLAKLLMDCFPLAAKATKPTNYFHLLRALFRAIGGGGGRFELLYNAVLPLLPEMLDSLNRQLLASEGHTRDMIVELCLTVPLRLTHLLPHLTYLMQPLALALRGSPDLVSQGLRTLELCIDNLTPDFLDPTLSTVLRELMEALHSHLKPLPANHHPAHTTIRILGKLGGRNRRLLTREPALQYRHHSEAAKVTISFGGSMKKIEFGPVMGLARRSILKGSSFDRSYAYTLLENCLTLMLHDGVAGQNIEEAFIQGVEGIFDALNVPDLQVQAESFIRKVAQFVFELEIQRNHSRGPGARLTTSGLLSSFLDAFPYGLARDQPMQAKTAQSIFVLVIQDLVAMHGQTNITPQDIMAILHQIANRITGLCLEDSWTQKSAGCSGIKGLISIPVYGTKWVMEREVDLIRTLLHVFKDLPRDPPRNVDEVLDLLLDVLRTCTSELDMNAENPGPARTKLVQLTGIFSPELQSSSSVVRQAAQKCIEFLVSLSRRPAVDLLLPHRERTVTGIYTKPLRALPFQKQIGMIEAIRYCVSLEPPLVELNDELLRLLHETLALADADDTALLGRVTARQGTLEVIQLRVACIKLLTASMPLTDFFQKQVQTRQRVTSVYFKSLYSPSPEVKDVAHEGLRMVLTHQSRLPKELLQTGLRPILMNLADPKRLSVPGLEGLARLLELLTNYFKVEIGHKLLDHFRIVADPQMLTDSSRLPLSSNEGITKLVRLANIFHLLPSAANIFLENLVNAIVQTESQMHFSTRSPFSEPLAKYLDRYPVEGIDFFIRHLNFPRHLRTLRSILEAKLAPNLERELASRTSYIATHFLRGADPGYTLPAILLFHDLVRLVPAWLAENDYVIDALLEVWYSEIPQPEQTAVVMPDVIQRHKIMLEIFVEASKRSPRIDLIFEIVSIFTRNLGMDLVHITHFLYHHVALSPDALFKRNILMRFLTWFRNPSYSWSHKAQFMHYVVSPILLVHANRPAPREQLLDVDFINQMHQIIWRPLTEPHTFSEADDMFKIEVLYLTTILVQHYSELLEAVKKDVIKCAWHFVTTSEDIVVKQTAYLLLARFFAAFQTPQKFILRAWTGLLRSPHSEGRASVRQEALATLAPSLPGADATESGHPQWAKATRRLLAEEGLAQHIAIYHLIVKQPDLFYPVRSLFVPHMANSLNKIGMSSTSTPESRLLSVDLLQVIYKWEEQAIRAARSTESTEDSSRREAVWLTPLGFRENMVSYLVRLATMPHDPAARATLVPRALALLQLLVGPKGWTDVTVGLRFFSRALEQNELVNEQALTQALAAAKVLQVITAEQNDAWFTINAPILQKLVRKGLVSEDYGLNDALHPIFDRLIRLFPLPKEEEEQSGELSEFHSFVYSAIGDGLRNSTALRGTLLMLKSVVTVTPERIEPFSQLLCKLLSKLAKEHIQTAPNSAAFENGVRLVKAVLEICEISVAFLGEQRRWLLSTLVVLVEKSKSVPLCRYILDLARTWVKPKQEAYPTMKEKASLLQKMAAFESRADILFQPYLELIYEIYTEPSLRRSDLTTRLEHSFLLGCHAKDPVIRERFMDLLDVSVPRSLLSRLTYIFGVQSWEALADHNWIYLSLHLILGAADLDTALAHDRRSTLARPPPMPRPKTHAIVRPVQRLLFLDPQVAHDTWVSVFPSVWSCLSRREQADLTYHIINLLSKDYHIRQAHLRPNVIQTLLAGIHACSPPMTLPPHLVKYLAKTFGAWYVSLEILGASLDQVKDDEPIVRDYVYDSLADVYAELAEEDLFYGVWRRRCLHQETNIALAYEQNGMWEQASLAYESAQSKARAGSIPFSESEYCLWEDHWILSAEKLQQWDLLYDLARNEGNTELMLESAWRTVEWASQRETLEEQITQLPDPPTPRRRVFEAFVALLKLPAALDKNVEFTKILEDAMQLSLRKWVGLPSHLSAAHVPLLQHFQQFVELQEAVQIFGSLSQTNAQNLEKKSSELKMVLQAWRERLPNLHDDISIWSDLVAWRQNVFHSINNAYIPLISGPNQSAGAASANSNTYGYRGYHETAWIINRFAHVARKHDLLDVCFTSLTKIYTLPNIEISEAFLKLREQARCHYQKPNDLQAGLEVINNTNLMFFSASQKAEFHTLKGMFHARLGRNDEANHAFGQAVQLDITQAKAWAEWGRFNDRMFKENPTDLSYAANAVSCYLQAAGQYKNGKSRPLISRILWLLSLDDHQLTISRAFDTYKGDAAFWFWIPLIPQLLLSLSHREVKQARYVLLNLARLYPQALFYQLRTTREEMQLMRKNQEKLQAVRAAQANAASADSARRDAGDSTTGEPTAAQAQVAATSSHPSAEASHPAVAPAPDTPSPPRQPSEYVDDVLNVLKTSFPLLILSLETMVDQISHKFKLTADEEIYRNICLLLQDAVQNYVVRMNSHDDDGLLNQHTIETIVRMSANIPHPVKKEYEEDFLLSKPNLFEYVQKLQQWRDRYEGYLDARPRVQQLATLSHYLTEFQYSKVDEIEVPGQYTEDKDSNQNFVRIQKFAPKIENCRSSGLCWRRFTVHASDNSKITFSVQLPGYRQYRREDRVMQVLRTFNSALSRKKESRKRNLAFHLPVAISLSPLVRLIQMDGSYVPLGDIYDRHCAAIGISREEPILFSGEKVKKVLKEFRQSSSRQLTKTEYLTLKKDIYDEVTVKMIPEDLITKYMVSTIANSGELWRMRKQFTLQIASTAFMTYTLCLSSRHPHRFLVSRSTGLIAMSELLPGVSNQGPVFATSDVVPFRFTPNMQHFVGPIFTEGLLTSGILAIARSLTDPEFELESNLCLFARDEVNSWMAMRNQPWQADMAFRHHVSLNIEGVVKRAETMACKIEREQAVNTNNILAVPVIQTVTNLISSATNPIQLAKMGEMYHPWF